MSTLIKDALLKTRDLKSLPKEQQKTNLTDDEILAKAIQSVDNKQDDSTSNVNEADEGTDLPVADDRGMFGGRQVEFAQEVYHVPDNPAGDETQPVGLLTQSDLNNYCVFRKGDRLTFRFTGGTSGACKYEAKKNGQADYTCEYDWSDALIQELIDEGACKLL